MPMMACLPHPAAVPASRAEDSAAAPGVPRYRKGRKGPALHFGRSTGAVLCPGRGYTAVPPAVTLFAKLFAADASVEQRILATSSGDNGLGLALGDGRLRLLKGGVGWVGSGLPLPAGVWVACAVSYEASAGHIRFFLHDYQAGSGAVTDLVERSTVLDGDGMAVVNSRSGAAPYVGAMMGVGLSRSAWSEDRFLDYVAGEVTPLGITGEQIDPRASRPISPARGGRELMRAGAGGGDSSAALGLGRGTRP